MAKLEIYGIVYGNKTTEYTPYVNKAKAKLWRFEYNPMIDIIDNHINALDGSDFLGIVSWKFREKTKTTKQELLNEFYYQEKHQNYVDVYNLSPNLGQNIGGCGCFMDWSVTGHGIKLRRLIETCCEYTGLKYDNNPPIVVYANQFIARKDVYTAYINSIIKPSIELMEGQLWEEVNNPAGYTVGLELELLHKQTGLYFYNYLPFVLERMFMQYLWNSGLKTVNLI